MTKMNISYGHGLQTLQLSVLGWEAEKAGDEQGDGDKKREAKASSDGEAHVDSTQQVKCIYLDSVSCLYLGCLSIILSCPAAA